MPSVRNIEVTASVSLITETCYQCSMTFAMPKDFQQQRLRDRKSFFCPAGHSQAYVGESKEQKLQRELDRAKQNAAYLEDQARIQRELREAAERRGAAARGQVTKLKKRAAAGHCPCCNRRFVNLMTHMAQKHPGFVAEPIAGEA